MVKREDIVKRLKQLGYEPTEADYEQVDFELNKMSNYVLNYCNIDTIPEIVEPRLIDRVCSEYLFYKKNSGQLEGFDYDFVIKSIKEGDTSITYAEEDGTVESRFNSFVKQLERGFDKWITRHRRLKW